MQNSLLTFTPLELSDLGDYKGAAELAGLRVGQRPTRGPESDSEHAEALLVAGIILATAGGIQQSGDQSQAREMIVESVELFGDNPKSFVARFWLAWSEYWAGDLDRALAVIEEVQDADDTTRFRALILKAEIYAGREWAERALAVLADMMPLYDARDDRLKGKFHGQKGRVLRLLNEIERASLEYLAALHFFEEAGDVRCQAVIANNLAGIYLETKQFSDASVYALKARTLFHELGDKTYEAASLDQLASVYLAEGKLNEAEQAINTSIELVNHGPVLNECLLTRGKIKQQKAMDEIGDNDKLRQSVAEDSLRNLPNHAPISPRERRTPMSPVELTAYLADDPDRAVAFLDFVIWILAGVGDPRHAAEVEAVQEIAYSKTPDCEQHRDQYLRSRSIYDVTDS